MKILAIDDSSPALKLLTAAITEAQPSAEVFPFGKPSVLLAFARENPCDIAFLDIQMAGMNGLALAKELKDLNPKINIIFVTAHSHYACEALNLYPSGYVLKPVTKEAVDREIENLRHPPEHKSKARIQVKTFGNFDVFSNGVPLKFRYNRSKEMLAYLVDRNGASANTNELCGILWENERDNTNIKSYLRKLMSDLMRVLREAGAEDIIQKHYNSFAIIPEKIDCDSYGFIQGDPKCVNAYNGQYMVQYSWAETPTWNHRQIIMQEAMKQERIKT